MRSIMQSEEWRVKSGVVGPAVGNYNLRRSPEILLSYLCTLLSSLFFGTSRTPSPTILEEALPVSFVGSGNPDAPICGRAWKPSPTFRADDIRPYCSLTTEHFICRGHSRMTRYNCGAAPKFLIPNSSLI